MLGEFGKEQDKFVSEKKQKQKLADAAVPPWVGYNEEETMKKQILALSMVTVHLLGYVKRLYLIIRNYLIYDN